MPINPKSSSWDNVRNKAHPVEFPKLYELVQAIESDKYSMFFTSKAYAQQLTLLKERFPTLPNSRKNITLLQELALTNTILYMEEILKFGLNAKQFSSRKELFYVSPT